MHEGHRARMRDKYLKSGISSLSEHEIAELLLFYSMPRVNTNEAAHRLIDTFGSLSNALDADAKDLINVKGIGEQTAVFLKLVKDIALYCQKDKWRERPVLRHTAEVGTYIQDMIGDLPYECFFVLSLDLGDKVISFTKLEEGTSACTNVDIRKILECAVRLHANKVVLAHNHPSGRLIPSDSDISLTRTLQTSFEPFGITVLDHIIVGGGGYISLAEKNYIK